MKKILMRVLAIACAYSIILITGCTTTGVGYRQLPGIAPDLTQAQIYYVDAPARQYLSTGDGPTWLKYSDFTFNVEKSTFTCANQKSRLTHSGEKLALADPVTLEVAEYMNTLKNAQLLGTGANGPKSGSVVWVEPGQTPGSIIMTTDASLISSNSWTSVMLATGNRPQFKLEFSSVLRLGGAIPVFLLGEGTTYWGATKGPVSILGRTYSNLKGAVMASDCSLK
jgi:hypothetical protein